MMEFTRIDRQSGRSREFSDDKIAGFLFQHLEQYGDEKRAILKCIDYVFEKGGMITVGHEEGEIKGICITNETGMKDYIPENILVYIAVDNSSRGKGYGRKLMEDVLKNIKGDVALHVEPDNPARHLYSKLGFSSKYLEMRYKSPSDD